MNAAQQPPSPLSADELDNLREWAEFRCFPTDGIYADVARLVAEHATLKETARKAIVEWLTEGDLSAALAALSRLTKTSEQAAPCDEARS